MPITRPTRPPPMSPGEYLRRRRKAAGLTVDDLATMIGTNPAERADRRNQLLMLEGGQLGDLAALPQLVLLDKLRGAMAFDKFVYLSLVAVAENPAAPVPDICRVCACTFHDACQDPHFGTCSWTEVGLGEAPLCTACEGEEPGPAEDRPVPEEELRHAA